MDLSRFTFIFGLISIPVSIALWFFAPDLGGTNFQAISDPAIRAAFEAAHSERWGIFVGLWPATLLVLSTILKK